MHVVYWFRNIDLMTSERSAFKHFIEILLFGNIAEIVN